MIPSLVSKLLGRGRDETAANLAAEMETRRVALAKAQAIVAAAADRRATALDNLDSEGMESADTERAAAVRNVEIAERALKLLDEAHAKAVRAEQAEARAAALAALVERRRVLAGRFDGDWERAAAVLADIISTSATLSRDIAECGFEREVERLPDVPRFLALNGEAVGNVSRWLGDALSKAPAVPESPKEASFREAEEARARRKAEATEARRIKAEAEREEGRAAREAEDAKVRARGQFYPTWRDALSDAAP